MIANSDIDVLQAHKEGIGARGITGPILILKGLRVPLSLSGQPNRRLDFADNVISIELS